MESKESYKRPEKELFDLPDLEFETPSFTRVCCPSCNHEAKSEHLNIQDKVAKCSNCHVVFSFKNSLKGLDLEPQKMKQEILRPEGIDLFFYKDEMDITFKQSLSGWEWVFVLVVFFVPYGIGMSAIKEGFSFGSLSVAVVAITIGLIFSFFRYRQQVCINIDSRQLTKYRKPKLWHKNKTYANNHIDQVYVKKRSDMSIWNVVMLYNEGKGQKHVVLTSVKSVSKAKYLEQEIERHLGIQDVHVPEEG